MYNTDYGWSPVVYIFIKEKTQQTYTPPLLKTKSLKPLRLFTAHIDLYS